MSTRAKWQAGRQQHYDPQQSHETVHSFAPIFFEDDFIGYQALLSEDGSRGPWLTVEVALNTAIAMAADAIGGAIALALDADSNAEDAVLYMGDNRNFDVSKNTTIEFRAALSVLPTTGVKVVMGLAGDHNLDKDTVTEAAWFALAASGALLVESDDTTNNNDDVATGITLVAGAYHVFKIDFTDLADVKFFVDGSRVAEGTTFDMSNLSAAEALMQPYFSLDKASGTGVGTLLLDYVRIWGDRA